MIPRVLVRTWAMARKEIVHIQRDPQILVFALGMPVVLILLFGYGVTFDIERIPLVVVDQDRTTSSRALVDRFTASGTFRVVARRQGPEGAEPLFRSYSAKAALVIPAGYERALKQGREAQAQLLLDGADNTTASITLGYAQAVSLSVSRDALVALIGRVELPLEVRTRTLFNPGLTSSTFLVPGLMVVILVMVAVMLTALTVAREYERGSMEQLFATPVGRLEIILGKLAPYLFIGLMQVLLVLTLGVYLFNVPVNGSLANLFLVATVFLLAMLMQGLLISVITRQQQVASMAAVISTFLPALLLSGFIFPIENMPWVLRAVATVLPAQYFVRALRAVLLRGNGLDVIWPDIAALTAFFVILTGIAVARFRRTLA
jgi:ABC-2 type transport system permease protein